MELEEFKKLFDGATVEELELHPAIRKTTGKVNKTILKNFPIIFYLQAQPWQERT